MIMCVYMQASNTTCALLAAVDVTTGQPLKLNLCEPGAFGCDLQAGTMWARKGCSGVFACGAHTVACAAGLECVCQSEEQRSAGAFHSAAAYDGVPPRIEDEEGASFARARPCRSYSKVAACGIEWDEWMMMCAAPSPGAVAPAIYR